MRIKMELKALGGKAQGWDTFIKIIIPVVIVLIIILWSSGAFSKAKDFGEKCASSDPIFEYRCANEIGSANCPGGWSTALTKGCPDQNNVKVPCCYREKP